MTAFKKFLRNVRGNMTTLFAASLIPITLLGGGLIDYSAQMKTKAKLQAALDNAVLGAAAGVSGPPQAQAAIIRAKVRTWLNNNLTAADKDNLDITRVEVTVSKDGTVDASVGGSMKTTFLKLVNINTLDVEAVTQTLRSYGVTEVALVLDTTGSMSGHKLRELKRAAKLFINTIYNKVKDRPDKDNFRVAIVPFSQYVNVGTKYRNASWIDAPAEYETVEYNCRWTRKCVSWGYSNWFGWTYKYCKKYGPRQRVCDTYQRKINWRGCVGSRNYPYNLKDGDYVANKIPAVLDRAYNGTGSWNYCPTTPILPLTSVVNDKATLEQKLNSMTALGTTYIPAGLIWGRRVLSHQAPFDEGASDQEVRDKNIQRVVILMTDGQNTRSPTYPDHAGSNTTVSDNLTAELCNRIKATDPATGRPFADIITISFDVHNNKVKRMLRACASMGSYDAQSGNLEAAFKSIGVKLARLHLSR